MFTLRFKRWLAIADELAWKQYRDPVGFWESVKQDRASRDLGPVRLATLCSLPILFLIALPFRQTDWAKAIAFAELAALFLGLGTPLAITVIGQPVRFWLLYVYSLPVLSLSFLCGLGLAYLNPIGLILGWVIGIPFFLGMFFTDACSIWVHEQVARRESGHARQRGGGPAAELPALTLQRRVHLFRFLVASLLMVAALANFLWQETVPEDFWLSLALVFTAVSCLRPEAVLFALIGHAPLTRYEPQHHQWRATYIGRTALTVPRRVMLQSLTAKGSAAEASTTLLALLREGSLGLSVRAACGQLPAAHLHALLLHLSLQSGGAEALQFLKPSLPPPLHTVAGRYADLAAEAAKPLDLQRWIALLPNGSEAIHPTGPAQPLHQILTRAREALLAYQYQPGLRSVQTDLANVIQSLQDPTASLPQPVAHPLSWPQALLQQLEHHLQRLQNGTGSPDALPGRVVHKDKTLDQT
jgi:hypothetical protein